MFSPENTKEPYFSALMKDPENFYLNRCPNRAETVDFTSHAQLKMAREVIAPMALFCYYGHDHSPYKKRSTR